MATVPAWTLRIVVPPGLETLGERCQKLVTEELASPIRQEVFERLKWYFECRLAHEIDGVRIEDEETYYLSRSGFRAPRFQVLYERWLREGDAGLEYASSRAVAHAIERGAGRVECLMLPHQYRHLSPVLGVARRASRGADEGEHTPTQPRPLIPAADQPPDTTPNGGIDASRSPREALA